MRLRKRTLLARRLRHDATEVEKRLWRALREANPEYHFRRQHPIGAYVVDFACPTRKLVIELDGGQHVAQHQIDAVRTAELARRGYRVIRFWNGDVVNNLGGVVLSIRRELEAGDCRVSLSALQGGEGGARAEGVGG